MDIQPIPIQEFQLPPDIESYRHIWISIGCKMNEESNTNQTKTSYQMIPEYIRQSASPSLVILVDNFVGNQMNIEYIETLTQTYPSVYIHIADTTTDASVDTLLGFIESMIQFIPRKEDILKICNFIRFRNTEYDSKHPEGRFYQEFQEKLFELVKTNNAHKYIYNWFGYRSNELFCNFLYPYLISSKAKETALTFANKNFIHPPDNNLYFTIEEIQHKIKHASSPMIKNQLVALFTGCISLVDIPPEILPTTTAGGGHKQPTQRKTRRRRRKIPKNTKRRWKTSKYRKMK